MPKPVRKQHDEKGIYVSLEELILEGKKASGFAFLPSQRIHSIVAGSHPSKLRGQGLDFEELKRYVPGDSVRHIDWRTTQRTGKAQVRIYNEDKERNIWLVVSQRNSMFFGSKGMFKSVAAAYASALALYRGLDQGDKVGAAVFNDEKIELILPKKSEENVVVILNEIATQNRALNSGSTANDPKQLNKALEMIANLSKHDDLIVLIGDASGLDDDSIQIISDINAHNDIIAVEISDPLERKIQKEGFLLFSDGEAYLDINTSTKSFSSKYKALHEERLAYIAHLSLSHEIPVLEISTDRNVLEQIRLQLGDTRAKPHRINVI